MSFVGDFLHTVFGGSRYSSNAKSVSREEIDQLVSQTKVSSLTQKEALVIEEAIAARRGSDGRISLHQIDEVLRKLEHSGQISEHDRDGVIKVFQTYLGSR